MRLYLRDSTNIDKYMQFTRYFTHKHQIPFQSKAPAARIHTNNKAESIRIRPPTARQSTHRPHHVKLTISSAVVEVGFKPVYILIRMWCIRRPSSTDWPGHGYVHTSPRRACEYRRRRCRRNSARALHAHGCTGHWYARAGEEQYDEEL